jgi:MFS family permease
MVLAHTAFAGGRVALSLSAIRLGGTPFQVGLVLGLLALVPAFLSVYAGRWTDRRGVFKPTLCALLMLEAALLLAPVPALASLGASAVLLGCGFMLVHLAINNAVGKAGTPAAGTHGFSMLALGISLSTVAGPVIAGFLVDRAGHAASFLALALLPMLALAVLAGARHAIDAPPAAVAPSARPRMADLFRHPPLRAVFIVSAALSMGWDLFIFMMPMHGVRIGLSASTIGLVMGAFGAGTFVVRFCIPALARRFTEWQILGGALGTTAAVYLLFPLFLSLPVLLVLAFILGLGLGCALPTIMSAIRQTAPPGRSGEAIGVRSMLINASQTLLPVAFGALGSSAGTHVVFWALAVPLGAAVVFTMAQKAG